MESGEVTCGGGGVVFLGRGVVVVKLLLWYLLWFLRKVALGLESVWVKNENCVVLSTP